MRALKSLMFATVALSASLAMAATDAVKVFVAPFTVANGSGNDWASKSIQQSLADELALTRSIELVDRQQDAQYVVNGTIQRNGEVRVTGRVTDAGGKSVGAFTATGTQRQLFAVEDSVAMQIKRLIAPNDPAALAANPSTRPSIQTPFAPANFNGGGGIEGSDLQRAMHDPRYLSTFAPQPQVVYEPQQPYYNNNQQYYPVVGLNGYGYNPFGYGYGYGFGYGGFGHGCNNWSNGSGVIIINNGTGGTTTGGGNMSGGGFHHGGGSFANQNGQAIRSVATWSGNPPSAMTHTMTGPQLVPGGTPRH